jgi:hypothetical protein
MDRLEITGHRTAPTSKKKKKKKRSRKPLPPRRDGDDFSIAEWCAKRRISASMFHKIRNLGLGPRVTQVGRRVTISEAADAEWEAARARDAATAA